LAYEVNLFWGLTGLGNIPSPQALAILLPLAVNVLLQGLMVNTFQRASASL
jgi:hypothetical protein